jgi:hypothetical protein
VKVKYDYGRIAASTDSLAAAYEKGYSSAMKTFLGQSGERLEITMKRSGVSRSRVSSERKWLMDSGRQSLCLGYEAYTLKGDDLLLQTTDSGVLEENDWEAGTRTIVVYPRGVTELKLDGKPVALEFGESPPPGRGESTPPEPDTLLTLERGKSLPLGRGRPLLLEGEKPCYFDSIELTAENLTLRYTSRGSITLSHRLARQVIVDLRGQ